MIFIDHKLETTAKIIAKEDGILAGIDLAQACFKYIDKDFSDPKRNHSYGYWTEGAKTWKLKIHYGGKHCGGGFGLLQTPEVAA